MDLALFDLDNTLLAGDSDYQWGQFLIEEGILDGKTHLAQTEQYYQDYKDGNLDIVAFLEFQLKPLADNSREQLDAWHRRYMERKIRPMMTEKARALVEKHRAHGDLMVVITATNSFVTAPIAQAFWRGQSHRYRPRTNQRRLYRACCRSPQFQGRQSHPPAGWAGRSRAEHARL